MGLTRSTPRRIVFKIWGKQNTSQQSHLRGTSEDETSVKVNQYSRVTNATEKAIYWSDGAPTPDQCRTHLKLMEAFMHLREDISDHDGLYGIDTQHVSRADSLTTEVALSHLREKRWQGYIVSAAHRFEKWWKSMAQKDTNGQIKLVDASVVSTPGALEALIHNTKPMTWSVRDLPPLDILMVLHGYMLNPRFFLEDCIRFQMMPLWRAGVPWALIDRYIEDGICEYNPPPEAKRAWEERTGCKWDSRDDASEQDFACPGCGTINTASFADSPTAYWIGIPTQSSGYLHQNASKKCSSCELLITPDNLSFARLCQSFKDIETTPSPLHNTLLLVNGMGISSKDNSGLQLLANLRRQPGLKDELLSIFSVAMSSSSTDQKATASSMQGLMGPTLIDKLTVPDDTFPSDEGHDEQDDQQRKKERQKSIKEVLHRWLTSHDHPSPFSLDLSSSVVRQIPLVERMHEFSWLYSPSLDLTLSRLLTRYPPFIRVIATHPDKISTPTHAIDLAWHTHQLTPVSYYNWTLDITRQVRGDKSKFVVNHDDRLPEEIISDAFEWTCQAYKEITGMDDYTECLCWKCVAILDSSSSSSSSSPPPPTTTTPVTIKTQPHHQNSTTRPSHSSTATPTNKDPKSDVSAINEERWKTQIAQSQYRKLEDDYARFVRRQRRRQSQQRNKNEKGQGTTASTTPNQKEFLDGYTWLFPDLRPDIRIQ